MSSSLGRKPHRFSLDEIKVATNNFDKENNLLGIGGEGEVYKGHIQIIDEGDTTVAIKLLKSKSRDRFDEEIKLVSGLHHTNLLSLIGYCKESDHKILVYEYLHKGSLAKNIYPTCSLEWMELLNICIGTARGLDYLHHGTTAEHKIIHRDVKPGNILLDGNKGAKLSDFGLLKRGISSNYQESNPIETELRGTRGYYAPEYVFKNEISRKTDVYAFGVVLLEVLCRKIRPWPLHDESSSTEAAAAAKLQDEDIGEWARSNIAADLKDQILVKCLDMFIDIARGCLLKDPNHRPTMAHVVSILQKSLEFQRKKSSFVLYFSSYYNSTSEKVETSVEDSLLMRLILQELLQVKVEEKNVSKYEAYRKELGQKIARKGVNDLRWPLLLLRGEYVGVDRFIQLYRAGKLASRVGGSPISFICGTCREENTCYTCARSYRFAVCKVCDTITGLHWAEKEQPSYCPNCQREQLYLRTLIRTNEGYISLEGSSFSCDEYFEGGLGVEEKDNFQEGAPLTSRAHHLEVAISLVVQILALALLYQVQTSRKPCIQSHSPHKSQLQPSFNLWPYFSGTFLEALVFCGQIFKLLVPYFMDFGQHFKLLAAHYMDLVLEDTELACLLAYSLALMFFIVWRNECRIRQR